MRLRDLGSSNGTYVDGARVAGEMVLSNGSTITIGETSAVVRFSQQAEPDIGATVRIDAIKRPDPPAAASRPPQQPADPTPAAPAPPAPKWPLPRPAAGQDAASPRPMSSPTPPPVAAGASFRASEAPPDRPVSRTDVFSPLGPTAAAAPNPVEKTMLEVPGAGRRPPGRLDEMRPREPESSRPAAPPPPMPSAPLPPGDLLGSIDALDGTALGARAVRQPLPPAARPGAPIARAAGFWIRLGAVLVDGVVVGLPLAVLNFLLTFVLPVEYASILGGLLGLVIGLGMPLVGWAVWGRTPGKALLRLAVVPADGSTPGIGFGKAIVRVIGYAVSMVTFGIGFLMAGFGDKLALHDKIAGTRVVRI